MFQYKNASIKIIQGDITEMAVDAIVNAANSTLLGGGGVDGAIHKVGGKIILEQCKKIGGCPTGEARITTAGNLPCNYVIHTVGPIYEDGKLGQEKLLYNAYFNSLKLAKEYAIKTIAFPSISTGAYNYPIEKAVEIVMKAMTDAIDEDLSPLEISFILFNEKDVILYQDFFGKKLVS